METCIVDGIACIKRTVENIEVYHKLKDSSIKGIAPVIKIENNDVYYQFINGKSLNHFQSNEINLTRFIYELVLILEDLKNNNIVHKDLKPENIVISNEGSLYLIDFDVSRVSNDKEADTSLLGTRGYASPEHYGYCTTTYKSDMFSLGKIIEEFDSLLKYQIISNRCMQIDPNNRYEQYIDIIIGLDKQEIDLDLLIDNTLKIDIISNSDNNKLSFKEEMKLGFTNNYNSNILVIYAIMFIFLFVSTFNINELSPEILIIKVYSFFLMIDIIDYVRVIVLRKKCLKFKLKLSLIAFLIMIIVVFTWILLFKQWFEFILN